jgi:hypothetical protein
MLGSVYDLQITALFFALYIMGKRFIKTHLIVDAVFFTLIIMNIVLTTGGLGSPFFFLIYFLLFALAMLLEPVVSLTTTLGILALFLPYLPAQARLTDLLPLLSLPFLVPFAVFLGSEMRKRDRERKKIASLIDQQSSTEQDALIFISTIVKGHMQSIEEALDNFHGDHELSAIRTSTRRLKKLIDKFEKMY